MANGEERRSFLKRSLEIIGGTAADIGKDYTSNFQELITDAASIKSTVIQGARDAKDTFERMKNGTGPIKGVLNWFYAKEGETSQWDLDDADSDFDAGTNFDTDGDEDENKGPGVLNVSDARDLTRGHINSMFKIASKISEAQIANTAEIVSTVNSRSSEVIASINNVNTTLMGISKQIDSIAKIVTAGAQKKNRTEYDSLLNYDGRLTLGKVFDASKNAVVNSNTASYFSTIKAIMGTGMVTPELALRLGYDMLLGDRKFKGLGDQSLNQLGGKVNDAIGQSISDALNGIISNKFFKKYFGDLKQETRTNNFKGYIQNEYTRDAAMFDGMTRKSIVDVIPGYLKMIHEDLSGNKTSINDRGQIVSGEGNTWTSAVSKSIFKSGAADSGFLDDLRADKSGRHYGLEKRDLNTINTVITGALIGYMLDNNVRMLDKKVVSSGNTHLITTVAAYLDGYLGKAASYWYNPVAMFLNYTESEFGRLNKFVNQVNKEYDRVHRELEKKAQEVHDQHNVDYAGYQRRLEASREYIKMRDKAPEPAPPPPPRPDIDVLGDATSSIRGNGDVPIIQGNIMGTGPTFSAGFHDILSDIRTLLATGVKKVVGTKKYSSIKFASSPPATPDMEFLPYEDDERDKYAEAKEEYEKLTLKGVASIAKDAATGFKESFQSSAPFAGEGRGLEAIRNTGEKISNKVGEIKDSEFVQNATQKAKDFGNNAYDWGKEKFGQAKDFAKDKADEAASFVSDKIVDRAMKGLDKATDYANNLGTSSEAEEDRNTVQYITSAMEMAIQNGAVSNDEKSNIQRLIDTIHDKKLKSKLKKHTNAILERSSFDSKTQGENGKKSIFGKVLGLLGIIVSPIKMLGKLATFILPKLVRGTGSLLGKVFGNDFKQLGQLGGQLKEEFHNLRDLRKQYKAEKAEQGERQGMTFGQAISPVTDTVKNKAGKLGEWAADKASTIGGYGMYYGGQLLDKGKEVGGKIADKAMEGAGYALYQGQRAVGALKDFGEGVLDTGRNLASGARDAFYTTKIGRRFDPMLKDSSSEPGKLAQVKENLGEWAKEKTSGLRELGTGFKLGTMTDFTQGFQEAAGIKKPAKVKIDGVDGDPETYTDQVVAKIYGVLTGQEQSVLTENEEKEKQEQEEQNKQEAAQKDDQSTDQSNDQQQNQSQQQQQTGGANIGAIKGLTDGSGSQQSQTSGSSQSEGGSWGADSGAGASFSEGGDEGAAGGEGDSYTGGGSTEGSGAAGALKSASTLMKIGGTIGKIAKILGGMGKIIGKILLKAVMMLSGFKALKKTLGSVIPMITKIISIGLKPLNKIFNFLNKTIKPIIAAVKKILTSVMEAVSGILSSVFDAIVPILNNIVTPVLNALMPMIDTVLNVLQPLFDIITSVIDVVLVPIGGLFKYVLLPIIKQIGNIMQIVMGILELGFGALMVPLGGILTAVGAIAKLFGGGSGLAESGQQMARTGTQMVSQGLKDIGNGIMSYVETAIKAITFQDQSEPEEDETRIENPNAREIESVGSVMDGYASGDVYNDSHNIQNISNIYGSGRAQGSYGGTLSMKDNGCGPVALADAYNRRHGTNVDGLAMASSMAKHGTYEPGKGTSVSSFMNASASLGSGLRAGGVTQSSLKSASPRNPITLVGSGSDFGTKSGNNHYVNVVGTDKYGGAYVSNPLTGRVDRRSASTLASNSLLGLYGSGDVGGFEMPDTVADALSELKNIAGSLLGMFTKSSSDAMSEQMSSIENESKLGDIKKQLNEWFKRREVDGSTDLPEDFNSGEESYAEYVERKAAEKAYESYTESHPRADGETEDAHKAKFKKWYTDARKLKYISEEEAYKALSDDIKKAGTQMESAAKSFDVNDKKSLLSQAMAEVNSAADKMKSKEGGGGSGSGAGYFTSDEGVKLWTDMYEDNIEITDTDITKSGYHSPLFEFFAKTMGESLGGIAGSGWFSQYNSPDKEGVGSSGSHHSGVDFAGANMLDKPLYATTGGTIKAVWTPGESGGGGNTVVWEDSAGKLHWYMHMSDITSGLAKGQKIEGGQLIGHVGYTGSVIPAGPGGTHLHYTINDTLASSGSGHVYNPLMYFRNYNPNGGADTLVGDSTPEKIWAYLRNNGATPEAAAGFMGVWQHESENDPDTLEGWYMMPGLKQGDIVQNAMKNNETMDNYVLNELFPRYDRQGTPHDKSGYLKNDGHYYPGFGLAQWTSDRTKALLDHAKSISQPFNSLPAQLDFWKKEVEGGYQSTFMSMNKSTNPNDATAIALKGYEGMGTDVLSTRQQYAREFYERYKDWQPGNTQSGSITGQGSVSTGYGMANSASDGQMILNYSRIKTRDGKNTGTVIVSDDSYLNLREKPDADSRSIGQYENGKKLFLRGCSTEGWYEVVDSNADNAKHLGYVSSKFIKLDRDETPERSGGASANIKGTTNTYTFDNYDEEHNQSHFVGPIQSSNPVTYKNEIGPANTSSMYTLKNWPLNDPSTNTNEGVNQRNEYYRLLAEAHKKIYNNPAKASNATYLANYGGAYTTYNGKEVGPSDPNYWMEMYLKVYNDMAKQAKWRSSLGIKSSVLNDYDYEDTDLQEHLTALAKANGSYMSYLDQIAKNAGLDVNKTVDPNKKSKQAEWFDTIGSFVTGKGDTPSIMTKDQASDLGGFASIMNSLTGDIDNIPDIDENKISQAFGEATATSNASANTNLTNYNRRQEERLEKILKNKFNVSDERVAQLLELILKKMDGNNPTPTPGGTPKLFNNDRIPNAVQRLSKG